MTPELAQTTFPAVSEDAVRGVFDRRRRSAAAQAASPRPAQVRPRPVLRRWSVAELLAQARLRAATEAFCH